MAEQKSLFDFWEVVILTADGRNGKGKADKNVEVFGKKYIIPSNTETMRQ